MDDKGFDSINVIPLVDVMLVLLTIVLTTSTFIAMGAIPVTLPKVEHSTAPVLKNITIEIDRQGKLYLDGKQHSIEQLKVELKMFNKAGSVLIRADKDIALQIFVDVMELVKGLGFMKVSLQTESSS